MKIVIRIGSYYRHYKGGIYKVLGIGTHTETQERLVAYASKDLRIWLRPYGEFTGKAPGSVDRFTFLHSGSPEKNEWFNCSNRSKNSK